MASREVDAALVGVDVDELAERLRGVGVLE